MADWSLLPEELLRLVLSKLSSPLDNARSGAVCKLWHSIYKERAFPWLVSTDHRSVNHTHGFFSLCDREVYHIKLPDFKHKVICGSSHGWLITMRYNCIFCLLDPFSGTQIQLPNLLFDNPLSKVVMSCDPRTNQNSCIIMAIASFKLVYCRLGDDDWTLFRNKGETPYDITFCKGQFYGRTRDNLYICHIDPEPHLTELTTKNPHSFYLVDLAGELLMIGKYIPDETEDDADVFLDDEHESDEDGDESEDEYKSDEDGDDEPEDGLKGFGKYPFHVYKGDSVRGKKYEDVICPFSVYKLDAEGTSLTKINDIGDQALLLGSANSVALPTSSFPCCARSAMYYADKYCDENGKRINNKVGFFDLNRSIHSQYVYRPNDDVDDFRYLHPPPIWLVQGSPQYPES